MPKPVIALVGGYAIGGGHVLHVICDLTIASNNAVFGQTGPRVGSFDAGFGASELTRLVGVKKAKEFWFLCEQYNAEQALSMGLINKIVEYKDLENEGVVWAKNEKITAAWKQYTIHSRYVDQASLEDLVKDFPYQQYSYFLLFVFRFKFQSSRVNTIS